MLDHATRRLARRALPPASVLLLLAATAAPAQAPADTTRPLTPDASKRLSEAELAHRPEGRYVTGLPRLESNPVNGTGFGGNIFLFDNGRRADPLFAYTPYRAAVGLDVIIFPSGRLYGGLTADIPYIGGKPWRLRVEANRTEDPNQQYFGFGTASLRPLTLPDPATGAPVTYRRFADYEAALARARAGDPALGEPAARVTDAFRNDVRFDRTVLAVGIERTLAGGRVRVQAGYEFQFANLTPYDGDLVDDAIDPGSGQPVAALQGRSRFTESLVGADGWTRFNVVAPRANDRVALLQGGLMYDTRDFEPDPRQGVFAEYAFEYSVPAIGSEYTFTKQLVQVMGWLPVVERGAFRTVLAQRWALGYLGGSRVPLSESWDTWSAGAYGGIEAIGGGLNLRGYRAGRFTGPVMGYGTLELRNRVARTRPLGQELTFELTPFVDVGRVWDSLGDLGLAGWRSSAGAGARIGWNQATVIRLDYAVSREDRQLFVLFGHAF